MGKGTREGKDCDGAKVPFLGMVRVCVCMCGGVWGGRGCEWGGGCVGVCGGKGVCVVCVCVCVCV